MTTDDKPTPRQRPRHHAWSRAVCLALLLLSPIVALTWGRVGLATIVGSAHDLSSEGFSGGEICVPCHTPHNASTTVVDAPLWNHEVTTATYKVYSSPTMALMVGQPRGPSLLCLSCHDGTVALDSFGGATGSTFISGAAAVGTDLSDDHPIGVGWLHQNAPVPCSNCHDPHTNPGQNIGPLPFFGNPATMECPTCHEPHNNGASGTKLLRMSNVGSALCLHCHGK